MPGPSSEHEVLVAMMKRSPTVLSGLLRRRVELGRISKITTLPASFSTPPAEYHADAGFVISTQRFERLVVLLEVQLSPQTGKLESWPAYEAVARRRHRAPACVVVLAPNAGVARWARRRVVLGPSGSTFRAIVVGPRELPRRLAKNVPAELAVLSALAHGRDPNGGAAIIRTAIRALDSVRSRAPETARLYFDLMAFKIKERIRAALEEMMPEGQTYLSDWFRDAEAKGIAKGIAKGEEREARRALREVLGARGLRLDAAAKRRISACTKLATIRRWTVRAATAKTLEDVFGSRYRSAARS